MTAWPTGKSRMWLHRVHWTADPVPPGTRVGPAQIRLLADLAARHGFTLRPDWVSRSSQLSHRDLAAVLLREIAATEPLDALAIANALPDVTPLASVGCYLSQQLPGRPIPVGIDEQGAIAPFTALRLLSLRTNPGSVGARLLFMFDRAELPYQSAASSRKVAQSPARNYAVALELGSARRGASVTVAVHAGTAPEDVPAVLASETARRPARGGGRTPDMEFIAGDGRQIGAEGAVWLRVCERWSELSARGCLAMVSEYDPDSRLLGICNLDFSSPGSR